MPNLNEIRQEINRKKLASQDDIRRHYLKLLSDYTQRDTIIYATAFSSPKSANVPGQFIALTNEDVNGFMSALHGLKGKELDLILHSPGGSMETAEQIVTYLRTKYDHIRAIVPQNAMSAATMLACACDSIVMGKHSAIGPIDPQITFPTAGGSFTAPAQAILDEFKQAKTDVANDPNSAILWVEKFKTYPHGFLNVCQVTTDVAKTKVSNWLDAYMFKNDPVKKGSSIGTWLGDATVHKTHGKPITIDVARSQGLKVEALEDDQTLQELVLSVFHSIVVTFDVTNCVKLVENQNGNGWYFQIQVQP